MSPLFNLSLQPFSLIAAIIVALCSLLGFALYRLYLHPLAKYPGPRLARLTGLHEVYHAFSGDRHLEFWRMHEKYGPVVRYSPNSLSFNTSTALRDIYSYKANVRKAAFYEAFLASKGTASTHSSIDKAVHARKRRVLSHAFSDVALRSMQGYIIDRVRQFCTNLAGPGDAIPTSMMEQAENKGFGPAINIAQQASWLTFDIMGDLCFGKSFGMLERPDNRFATELVANASQRHLICGTCLPLHHYHLDKILFRKIAQGRARYMQYSKAQAAERTRLGQDADRRDFFHYLLQAKDPETGAGFTPSELWGESNLLIIAGSDTTSTALASTVFYLVHKPESLARLAAEVRSAFADIEEIKIGSDLSRLAFLRACIDEAMRLSPPVGGLLPREVLSGGMTIDGYLIPEGTIVGTPHYSIHHNEKYYPQPFEYKPERWIVGAEAGVGAERVAAAHDAFCPFSIGPRGCIGKGMAYAELTITIARMVFMYDLRLSPGRRVGEGSPAMAYGRHRSSEFQLVDTFASRKYGPLVQFRARVRTKC